MNYKYVLFLILFVFNFTETTVADSSHFDMPNNVEVTDCDHHNADEKADEQCQDHECCHLGHIHVYLLNFETIELNNKIITTLFFPAYKEHFSSISFDIIKPPIV